MEELTLGMMKIKLLQLQEFIDEKKAEYELMRWDDAEKQAFCDGAIAACTFFEKVLNDVLNTKEELKEVLGKFDETH